MTHDQLSRKVDELWRTGFSTNEIARVCAITVHSVAKILTSNNKAISSNPNVTSRTTKSQLVDRIAGFSGVDRDKLVSLEKANHEALELVLASLQEKRAGSLSF